MRWTALLDMLAGDGRVEIDTRQALAGLHLPPPATAQAPAAPETAMPAGQGANP